VATTYNDALLTDKDKVRASLGDTDMASPLMSDEHITAVLVVEGSIMATVEQLAHELVARFGRQPVTIAAGDVRVDYSERLAVWRELANRNTTAGSGSGWGAIPATYGAVAVDEYSRRSGWN